MAQEDVNNITRHGKNRSAILYVYNVLLIQINPWLIGSLLRLVTQLLLVYLLDDIIVANPLLCSV